jgi:glyoxylase-like metal-dependent hydrolase (beta-lactamase superfamily II)
MRSRAEVSYYPANMLQVISIGTLAANTLWNERAPVRTGHATTTLIVSRDAKILVDPGLPGQILGARLHERTGLSPRDVTHVFLTSFRPDVRRGIELFDQATWYLHSAEREAVGVPMAQTLKQLMQHDFTTDDANGNETSTHAEILAGLQQDIALLQRCEVAPDSIADRVDIFPLPGVTPGLCGLLIEEQRHTTLICGDAIPTAQHLIEGKLSPDAADFDKAKTSFEEAVEIADLLVLGRDNLTVNPTKRPF